MIRYRVYTTWNRARGYYVPSYIFACQECGLVGTARGDEHGYLQPRVCPECGIGCEQKPSRWWTIKWRWRHPYP